MTSESARATTAAEARFRIDYPNSKPRAVKVVALDAASEDLVKRMAQMPWARATFLTSLSFESRPKAGGAFSMQGWLNDLAGATHDLIAEIETADLVVMVASAGSNSQAAAVIGETCNIKKVMTTALVLDAAAASDEVLSRTLSHLRPYVSMLVVANGEDYVEAMLAALRA